MKKIYKLLKGISALLKKPSLINHVLNEDERWRKYVIDKYGLSNGLPTVPLSKVINQDDFTVDTYSFLGGGSMVTDLALLKYLALKKSSGTYFEIGSWRGESLANVAPFVKEAYSMNLSDEEMQKLGMAEDYISQHFSMCRHLPNIEYIRANSITYNWVELNKKFDLIFVDGDHHYESVKSDTYNVFKKIKDNESVIVWHDYAYSPENIRWEVLAAILDGTCNDNIGKLFHVENTMCAIYINSILLDNNSSKALLKTYSINISLNR